jgi:hypothetical protein
VLDRPTRLLHFLCNILGFRYLLWRSEHMLQTKSPSARSLKTAPSSRSYLKSWLQLARLQRTLLIGIRVCAARAPVSLKPFTFAHLANLLVSPDVSDGPLQVPRVQLRHLALDPRVLERLVCGDPLLGVGLDQLRQQVPQLGRDVVRQARHFPGLFKRAWAKIGADGRPLSEATSKKRAEILTLF